MTETSPNSRYKAEMPQIPGVSGSGGRSPKSNPLLPLIVALVLVGVVIFAAVRWLSRSKPAEVVRVEPTPQIEVPSPPPDPNSLLAHATPGNPAVATLSELAKPWSSVNFFIRNPLTGENVPATIVRLPGGGAGQVNGYWAFSRKSPYGRCELEYIPDVQKLRDDYDYRAANHPLVGNPCSRTLYDPLKMASLAGNIWIRGAIVQGSDIRPPLGVEIKIQGKEILAIRTE